MTSYSIRVELHDAAENDYTVLHSAMYERKFYNVVKDSSTGQWFKLPPAEYNSYMNLEKGDVLNLAIEAANETNKKSSIFVTKSAGRTWHNLEEVKIKA